MIKRKLDEQRGSEPQNEREHNPLGKKKRKFPVKKNKLVVHRCDPVVGLSYRKISEEDGLDYDELAKKPKHVARSALVKQHDSAVLLNFKPKPRNNKPETRKSDVAELARRFWESFPEDLKEELRRNLKDSDHDGIPDAFE